MGTLSKKWSSLCFLVIVLTGCVSKKENSSDCASDEVFNSRSRSCVKSSAVATPNAPTATLDNVVILEDSAAPGQQVILTYTVPSGSDFASSCTATIQPPATSNLINGLGACQCLGGVCNIFLYPDPSNPNFYGVTGFTYSVTNSEGTSNTKTVQVLIQNVDDAPTSTFTGSTSFALLQKNTLPASPTGSEQSVVAISSLQYEDLDGDKATSCATSNLTGGMIGGACVCDTAGVCSVSMLGTEEVPLAGITRSFDYTVTASGATSATNTVNIDWTHVADAPVLTLPIPTVELTHNEDNASVPQVTVNFSFTDADGDLVAVTDTCSASSNQPLELLDNTCGCTLATASCTATFNLAADFNGTPTFDLYVDINGASSTVSTVSLNINDVNDVPTASGNPTINQFERTLGAPLQENEMLEFIYQVDEGGGSYEDSQNLQMRLLSSNASILPASSNNLKILYDDGAGVFVDTGFDGTNFVSIGTASLDVGCAACRIKIQAIPERDQSTGNAAASVPVVLTVDMRDDGGTLNGGSDNASYTLNVDFLDRNDAPTIATTTSSLTPTFCQYTLALDDPVDCPGTGCTGSGVPPQGTMPASPTADSLIYFDSNGFCYYSESGVWTKFGKEQAGYVRCPVSSTVQAPICAALGRSCIGSGAPTLAVGATDVFFYYDKTNNDCYKSSGGTWSQFSVLDDKIQNEKDPFIYKQVIFDEGRGDDETQELRITVTSNNTTLIPNNNISIEKNGNTFSSGPITGLALEGAGAVDASSDLYTLKFNPVSGASGTATITLTITESNAVPSNQSTQVDVKVTVNPVSAIHGQWSNVVAVGQKIGLNDTQLEDAYITIGWNDFILLSSNGATISGWNVYRRGSATASEMDYDNPLNATPLAASTRSYTDTFSGESVADGATGVVYYYEVRPIDSVNSIPTSTSPDLSYREIRVVKPPKNTSFVHRWIANIEVCSKLKSPTDPDENFRCPYAGPGEILTSSTASTTFYDIGNDYLVDTYEVGCDFSDVGAGTTPCTDSDGCIGVGSPTGQADFDPVSDGLTYYDRGSGKCSFRVNSLWYEFQSASISLQYAPPTRMPYDTANTPGLPPLTHISQEEANNFCNQRSALSLQQFGTAATVGGSTTGEFSRWRLPLRKEQISFAAWDSSIPDTTVDARETGLSLNSSPNCNSSSASGYSSSYEDSGYPGVANLFTLPATKSSGIRSVSTGSDETRDCISRYGIQDLVGNVSEWVLDRIYCRNAVECEGITASTTRNFCTYDTTAAEIGCGSAGCIGDLPPTSTASGGSDVTAVEEPVGGFGGAIFRDRKADKCYRATASTTGSWAEFSQGGCPVSLDCSLAGPAGGSVSCIGNANPNGAFFGNNDGASNFSVYLDYVTGTCYRNTTAAPGGSTWTADPDPFGLGQEPNLYLIASGTGFNQGDFDAHDLSFDRYRFDGLRGPCNEGGNGFCDTDVLTSWIFSSENFFAGRFIFPLGLPAHTNFPTEFPSSAVKDYLLEIGPSSGITSTQLHNDKIIINSDNIFAGTGECGSLSTGGSYLNGNGSGRYFLEAIQCASTTQSPSRGFRCVAPIQY